MFETTDVLVINKMDLAPYTNFDVEAFEKAVREVNTHCIIVRASAFKNEGVDETIAAMKQAVNM